MQAYIVLFVAFAIAWAAKFLLLEFYCVHMASMEPTLIPGDRVLSCKTRFVRPKISRGDVVALEHPLDASTIVIKRCAAVGGEFLDLEGTFRVPPRHLFVLGDNEHESLDSRQWGPIPEALVKGKLLLIIFSVEPSKVIGGRVRWTRFFRHVQ